MQYNTALCILLSGIGSAAFHWRQLRLAQVFAGMVMFISGFTLCEYLFGIASGIDQLFFHSYITTLTSNPGRMSPAAALCLLQIGLALFFMGFRSAWRGKTMLVGSMGAIVVAICGAAILGYAIDFFSRETYGWGRCTCLALHSAAGLVLLGAGIFAVAWNGGRKPNEATPRWLPVSLALSALATSLVFSRAVESRQTRAWPRRSRPARKAGNIIALGMETRIRSLERMAMHWEIYDHLSRDTWENAAKNFARDFPDFQAMEWVDSSHSVRWTAPPLPAWPARSRTLNWKPGGARP